MVAAMFTDDIQERRDTQDIGNRDEKCHSAGGIEDSYNQTQKGKLWWSAKATLAEGLAIESNGQNGALFVCSFQVVNARL